MPAYKGAPAYSRPVVTMVEWCPKCEVSQKLEDAVGTCWICGGPMGTNSSDVFTKDQRINFGLNWRADA